MGMKYSTLTIEQKIYLRRATEDAIRAMNPNWGEFRRLATGPAIISLFCELEEKAEELHKTKMALSDAGCLLVEWKKRTEAAEQRLQQPALADVIAERQRQISAEGWTPEHDDGHVNDEIAAFAALYAMPEACRDWPAEETGYGANWAEALCPNDWVAKFGDRRRELVKAGALIIAEIERLDRANNGEADHE